MLDMFEMEVKLDNIFELEISCMTSDSVGHVPRRGLEFHPRLVQLVWGVLGGSNLDTIGAGVSRLDPPSSCHV